MTAHKCGGPGVEPEADADHESKHAQFTGQHDEVRARRKRFDRLRALLALRGHELYSTDGGIYIVRRWGLCRDLTTLDAVEKFAQQVGAL